MDGNIEDQPTPNQNDTPPADHLTDSDSGAPEPSSVVTPNPGDVITSQPTESVPAGLPPAPRVVTSDHSGGGKKRWLKLLITLIVLALLVAGGLYAYKKHQDNQKADKVATQSKDISLLKIGIEQGNFGKLYPDMNDTEYAYLVNSQIFEGLVRYEDKSKIVPALASTWTNPDSTNWVFTIKSGIKFHDGNTLTAKDVKSSFDNLIASDSQVAQDFSGTIASVSLVGSNQVKITTKAPDPTLLNKLSFLYIIDPNLPKGDDPSQAGTGPYVVKPGTKPTNNNVQMVAYDAYRLGRPTTRALDFSAGGNSPVALVKAFNAHKYDIVGPVSEVDGKSAPNTKKFTANEADVEYLAFNTVKPGPLQNKLVREAIRYAVNPLAIGSADDEQVAPESQLIPQQIPGYNPAIPAYKQNIAKAKQLLAKAGYPKGLTIRFSTTDGPGKYKETANELKQVGITLTADPQNSVFQNDFSSFVDYFSAGKAEMYDVDYSSDTLDGLDIYTTTLPTANYDNPQLNDILAKANTTIDPAVRLKLLQQAATIIDQDIPVVPLYSEQNLWLMNKDYVIHQDMPSSLISAYFYKVHYR